MTPKSFELMSDLEKMVLEDVTSYQTKQDRALLSRSDFVLKSKALRNSTYYSKAVTDYWSNYFDERP
jgi:hypothetical protein